MSNGESGDAISIAHDLLARLELGELQCETNAADGAYHDRHELTEPTRPVDAQRLLTSPEVEGLEQTRQPQPVVGVIVRQKDVRQVGEADRGDELALGSLAAIEKHPVASPAH